MASGRFRLGPVCLGVAALAVVYAFALPRVVPLLLPLPLGARIAVAILVVAPLGFLMGMPFPRGLQMTGRGPFPLPPFYWGLNGIFSVVGSMATMVAGRRSSASPGRWSGARRSTSWPPSPRGRSRGRRRREALNPAQAESFSSSQTLMSDW